jgi:inner membrane protein
LWLVNQAIRRKNQKHPQARFVPLLLVSAIGLFSHVLMDFPNNYGIRLWLPFSNQWSYGDFVFVVDPWLFLILAGALFLSGKRGMQTILLWAIAGIILTLLILLFPYARLGVKVVWLILIGALAALRHRLKNISSQRYARLALALAALYYGIMFGFKWRAAKLLADALRPAEVIAQVVTPMPGNIFQWAVFRETGERVDFGRINHIFAEPQIQWVKNFPKNFEAPFVQAALQTCTGRVMLDFARYPAAMIEEDRAGFRVSLYDVRSATLFSTRGENWAKASVIVHKDLTTEEPEPCPR